MTLFSSGLWPGKSRKGWTLLLQCGLAPVALIQTIMSIQVTSGAALRIQQGLSREGISQGGMRLGVKGGGCSGLLYVMRFEPDHKPGDRVFEKDGAQVFVDLKSYLYLKGLTLDWKGDLIQQGFAFVNPNASKTCSCGQSFLV